MLKVNISAGNDETNEWDEISLISFKTYDELYPDQYDDETELLGLDKEVVNLPNNEVLELDAAYSLSNRGLNIIALCGSTEILNVSCFKQGEEGWDPSIVVKTPGGLYVSLMFGNEA